MDFELSDEQAMFRNVLQDFVRDHIVPVAHDWEQQGRYPIEIVDVMKSMGLFGMTVPESYGGMGSDMVSLALVFEELSRGWMGIAGILGSHSLSCWMINRYGTEAQKTRYLPELATGKRRTCIALTEPDTGSDLQGITTRAWRDGDAVRDPRREVLDHERSPRGPDAGTRQDRPVSHARAPWNEHPAGRRPRRGSLDRPRHRQARVQGPLDC